MKNILSTLKSFFNKILIHTIKLLKLTLQNIKTSKPSSLLLSPKTILILLLLLSFYLITQTKLKLYRIIPIILTSIPFLYLVFIKSRFNKNNSKNHFYILAYEYGYIASFILLYIICTIALNYFNITTSPYLYIGLIFIFFIPLTSFLHYLIIVIRKKYKPNAEFTPSIKNKFIIFLYFLIIIAISYPLLYGFIFTLLNKIIQIIYLI